MLRLFGFVIAALVLIGVAFALASVFLHRASVVVTLRSFTVPVSGSFEASPTGTNLAFVNTVVTEELSKTVPSTGTARFEDTASGTITILNAQSPTSQRLITNTRFESKDGRIYRIKAPVTVPGYTGKGSSLTPGSLEVTVYADTFGEQYNLVGPADFTLPGLKGSAQFDTITAHLSGSIDGGFAGDRAVVSEAVHAQAVEDLSAILIQKVRAALIASLGPDDLVFPDSISISFVTHPDTPSPGGAEVTMTATASAPAFSHRAVAKVIAGESSVAFLGPLGYALVSGLGRTGCSTSGNASLLGIRGAATSPVFASLINPSTLLISSSTSVRSEVGKDSRSTSLNP
jgi:hypothetical protein